MANPITVFNTDILTTISSVEYNGASGVNVDNENRLISLDENTLSAVSSVENKLDITAYHEYSAGNNIDITDYEISGKDWTTDISNASSYAYNQATAQIPSEFDPTYMSGQIDNKLDKSESANYYPSTANPSGYLVPNDITALANKSDLNYVSGKVDSVSSDLSSSIDYVSGAVDYVSGSLTSKQDKLTEEQLSAISSISSLDGKFYPLNENPSGYLVQSDLNDYATTEEVSSVSSELSNQIDYLSGHAGKTYEGVLPISVDNANNEISISSTPFSVQEPLYFVENSNTSVVVGFSGDTFTGASVNIPLTGDGTTASPLGLMSYISWGGNGTTSTFTRSGVRVLDENNNSAYYLASGLNLNNESITDSAISSWNDARTTVETNSANWGGITSVDTNHGISGDGTTSSPIGIASSFQLENPSVYTTATYKGDSIGIEGMMPRMQLKTNDSAYNTLGEGGMTITHSASGVGGGYTTSHYGSTMRLNYNDGDYYLHTMDTTKSGLGVAYKANSNVKAYYNYSGVALTNDNGATNEYVNVSSIRNWNDVYDTVSSNSASWTGGGGSIDTLPFFVQEPLTTGISGSSAYIALTGGTDNTAYVPYSAIGYYNSFIYTINDSGIYAQYADNSIYADTAKYDFNGNEITTYYQPTLTFGVSDNTITSINNTAVGGGGTPTATWELVEGTNISIVDSTATSSTTISVSGISANEWNDVYDTVSSNSSNWGGGGSVGDYLTATDTSSISSFKFSNNLQVSPYEVYKGATISGYGLGDNEEAGNFVLNGRVLGLTSRGHYAWGDNSVGVVFTPYHISGDNYVLSSDGLKFSWYDSTIQDMNTWKAVTANTAGVASANDFVTQNGVSLSSLNSATEWNETYNAVNTNSGTWGGSALNISAGSGVKVELVDNTLVFSNDETMLWSGTGHISSFTLSEKLSNFEKFRFVMAGYNTPQLGFCEYYSPADGSNISYCYEHYVANSDGNPLQVWAGRFSTTDSLTYNIIDWKWMCMPGGGSAWTNSWNNNDRKPIIRKVIGINRINNA